ncbi:MAG: hypothetical protein C0410_11480 [Anaerolinea sp.]|nr:hypothetical protein [Anaerolinea sp.]
MEAGKQKEVVGVNKVSFAEGLRRISQEGIAGGFTEREKEWFEKIENAEEKSKQRRLVLGRQI